MSGAERPTLVILGGLPGVGKTTIARALARATGAVHLRIDSIEEAIRGSHLRPTRVDDAGSRVAYAVAEDNLRLGRAVIADSVNPIEITRAAWRAVAARADARKLEIELVCGDAAEHRRRVETRTTDIPEMTLPDWRAVQNRDYAPWPTKDLVIDTHSVPAERAADRIAALI